MSDLLELTGANLLRTHRRLIRERECCAMPAAFSGLLVDPMRRIEDALGMLLEAASVEGGTQEDTEISPGQVTQFGSFVPVGNATASLHRGAEAFGFPRGTSTSLSAARPTRQPELDVQPAPPVQRLPQPGSLPDATGDFRLPPPAGLPAQQPESDVEPAPPAQRLPQPGSVFDATGNIRLPAPAVPVLPSPGLLRFPRAGSAPPSKAASFVEQPTASAPAQPSHAQDTAASRAPSLPNPLATRARTAPPAASVPPFVHPASSLSAAAGRSLTRMALGAPALGALLQANLATTQPASLAADAMDLHTPKAVPQPASAVPQIIPSFAAASPPLTPAAPDVEAVLEELEQRLRLELLRAYGTSGA